jgi:hypothetical protein
MPFVVMIHATFDTLTDAQAAYSGIQAVADKTKREKLGQAGERTSWASIYDEQADGSLVELDGWFIDEADTVMGGKPLKGGTKLTLLNTPAWGVLKTYPLNYDVAHINKFWRSQIDVNVASEPNKGNANWVEVANV